MAIARRVDSTGRSLDDLIPDEQPPNPFATRGQADGPDHPLGVGTLAPSGDTGIQSSESPRDRAHGSPPTLSQNAVQANGMMDMPGGAPDIISQLTQLMTSGGRGMDMMPAGSQSQTPQIARAPQILTERSAGLLGRGGGLLEGGIGARSLAGGPGQNSLRRTVKRFGQ